jgi:hypothetical protein
MRKLENIFERLLPVTETALKFCTDDNGNIPKVGNNPKFSDTKVITLSLAAEFLSIDSENRLFAFVKESAFFNSQNIIDRSCYNRRRKYLLPYYRTVLDYLSLKIAPDEDVFIVDSFPIQICRFARAKRSKICKENFDTAPDFGYCAAQRNTFFGYKLHALCGTSGVFKTFDISKASIFDVHYLQDIKTDITNCILLGDKAYLGDDIQLDLFNATGIRLYTPKRRNQTDFQKYPPVMRKLRKRIETAFSQLCDQFMIQRNYAKSFLGVATRIISKIVAFTAAQYANKFFNNKSINNVKYAF